MQKIRLGQKKSYRPTGVTQSDTEKNNAIIHGYVSWIHPEGIYFIVSGECNGYTVRECFLSKPVLLPSGELVVTPRCAS